MPYRVRFPVHDLTDPGQPIPPPAIQVLAAISGTPPARKGPQAGSAAREAKRMPPAAMPWWRQEAGRGNGFGAGAGLRAPAGGDIGQEWV